MGRADIVLADEGMHPVDDHPQFNESALLTFFDPQAREGGFLRIGNRPNEGHAEATFCWFLPDGSALFSFDRAVISANERLRTEHISIDVVEPGRTLTAAFRGQPHHLASPRLLVDPKAAFAASPKVDAELVLTLEGLSPMFGAKPFPGLETGGHYEQHMRGAGVLASPGGARRVAVQGNRDHSWGPRVWQATYADRTLWCTFGEDFGIALSITWRSERPDDYEVIGEVWRGGVMTRVVDVSIRSRFEDPERLFHGAFSTRVRLADGSSLEIEGRALAIAPLRHRRGAQVTHIGWGMAEFTSQGRAGVGLSEYLDVAGAPG
jgi:hypothetical protein